MIEFSLWSVFSQMWWLFLIAFALGIFKVFLPSIKGKLGERYVRQCFERHFTLPYILINDMTLKDEFGNTTQIDHIVLSPFGIFVIETKNYKGWIFGNAKQKQWTQTIYQRKHKFQNPIHQNYKHIKTLQHIFQDLVPQQAFYNMVLFVGDAEFKTQLPEGVFNDQQWIAYIKSFQQALLSTDQIAMIQQRLEMVSLEKSWKTNREHVTQLKQRHQQKSPE